MPEIGSLHGQGAQQLFLPIIVHQYKSMVDHDFRALTAQPANPPAKPLRNT